ncbi:acyl-CoA dehydrogenase family protein [Streptomyces chattanoogensis]
MNRELLDAVAADTDRPLRRLLDTRVNPGAAARDAAAIPLQAELLHEAAQHGLFHCALPADACSGRGFDPVRWGLVLEHIGYRCTDLSFPLLVYLTAGTIRRLHHDRRTDLLEPMSDGGRHPLVGFAYTEQRDPFDFRGSLTRHGDTITVSTEKSVVAGARILDAFLTYVPDAQGRLTAVLLHGTDPGVSIAPLAVSGFRAAGFGTVRATDTVVPCDRIVDTDGLAHAQRLLNAEAAFFVAAPAGRMRAIAEACALHAATTERHGTPLADYPNVQSLLGRMHALVESCRATLYRALETYDEEDPLWSPLSWIAKYTVGQHALTLAAMAQRLTGTHGFLDTSPCARHLRDFSGLLAGGNPQEKVEIDLGVHLTQTIRPILQEPGE